MERYGLDRRLEGELLSMYRFQRSYNTAILTKKLTTPEGAASDPAPSQEPLGIV